MFYQGSLQDGITVAVREGKAVVCFVREQCSQWESEYFGEDEQFAQSLEAKAVILRLTAGSQEAGFLASFCPISKYPTVVIIKNGSLREYLVPEISKDDFRSQIVAAVNDSKAPDQRNMAPPTTQDTGTGVAGRPAQPAPEAVTQPAAPASSSQIRRGHDATKTQKPSEQQRSETTRAGKRRVESVEETKADDTQGKLKSPEKTRQQKKERANNLNRAKQEKAKDTQKPKATPIVPGAGTAADNTKEASEVPQKPAPTLPNQYRLQVRLFDGSSVRSSFSPSQTIHKDVRAWLDGQSSGDGKPYNLMHILTPLPNHTLSIAEEDKTLEQLGLGPSANLVMVPIQSYTEAYMGSASSLPARAVSSAYNMAYSAANAAGSLVGSILATTKHKRRLRTVRIVQRRALLVIGLSDRALLGLVDLLSEH
ncbi:UBX domain protein [Aspergillus sp. HF37]|nr:UBX domain protein [Aspergillus sp. HF37]